MTTVVINLSQWRSATTILCFLYSQSRSCYVWVLNSLGFLAFNVLMNPGHNQVSNLQIVLIRHQHMAVTKHSGLREMEHRNVAPRTFELLDECLAIDYTTE